VKRHNREAELRPNLSVKIAGVELKNPVMPASGTFGYGEEYSQYIDINNLGAIVVKGISMLPHPGNPPPRTIETAGGMLNAIGLENVGVEGFIKEKLPFLRKFIPPIFVNFFGDSEEEYREVARRLSEEEGIAGLEMNISCPNVKEGGIRLGTDPKQVYRVTRMVRKATSLPLIVKLSPNVTDIKTIARAGEEAGADGLTLINTITGMAIDLSTRKPVLGNITGGLSGPAIKPVALRMVFEVSQVVSIPLLGAGGIFCARDAMEFMVAGASGVQVGTANFTNPAIMPEIIEGIDNYLKTNGISDINHLVGSLAVPDNKREIRC